MESKALADGLVAMARRQAARPNGRESVVAALRAALAAVGGCEGCPRNDLEREEQALMRQLDKAAEHAAATLAHIEAAEFLAERWGCGLIARPQPSPAKAHRSARPGPPLWRP